MLPANLQASLLAISFHMTSSHDFKYNLLYALKNSLKEFKWILKLPYRKQKTDLQPVSKVDKKLGNRIWGLN